MRRRANVPQSLITNRYRGAVEFSQMMYVSFGRIEEIVTNFAVFESDHMSYISSFSGRSMLQDEVCIWLHTVHRWFQMLLPKWSAVNVRWPRMPRSVLVHVYACMNVSPGTTCTKPNSKAYIFVGYICLICWMVRYQGSSSEMESAVFRPHPLPLTPLSDKGNTSKTAKPQVLTPCIFHLKMLSLFIRVNITLASLLSMLKKIPCLRMRKKVRHIILLARLNNVITEVQLKASRLTGGLKL